MITFFNNQVATTKELQSEEPLTPIGGFTTTFKIDTLPTTGSDCTGITTAMTTELTKAGYTKSVCPFGILMVGTAEYSDSYL
jgi:hypothetical protein